MTISCERIKRARATYEKLALDMSCAIAILYIEHRHRLPHVRDFRRNVTGRP